MQRQLGKSFDHWTKNNKAVFANFDEFIERAFAEEKTITN
jgi:hypothetical protein